MMTDRIKYEIFRYLWNWWHCRLPRFKLFMKWHPPFYDPDLYDPFEIPALRGTRYERRGEYRYWVTGCGDSRPWWHLCCNGDSGGWRTAVCDYLEHKWRSTKYYEEG